MSRGLLIIAILVAVPFAIGCKKNGPSAPGPTSFTVSGNLSRARSGFVSGASVQLTLADNSVRTTVSSSSGRYSFADVPAGTITIMVSSAGYYSQTESLAVSNNTTANFTMGNVWPDAIMDMFGTLSVPSGLLFQDGGSPSAYGGGVVSYGGPPPQSSGGKVGEVAHEVCHAHQDVNSRGQIGFWNESTEGQAFIAATGWHREGGVWIDPMTPTWNGYPSPLEDAAETCAHFINPGGVFQFRTYGSERERWAETWLLR